MQKFYNMLVTCDTIRYLWRRWRTAQKLRSPDTLRLQLVGFPSIASNTVSESTVFGLPGIIWSSRFLQLKKKNTILFRVVQQCITCQNTINHRITDHNVLTWWPNSKPQSVSSWVRLHCMSIWAVFKTHTDWSNAQHVRAPFTTILPTTVTWAYGLFQTRNAYVDKLDYVAHLSVWPFNHTRTEAPHYVLE